MDEEFIKCRLCDMEFKNSPDSKILKDRWVCWWCFGRGRIWSRYTLLWRALKAAWEGTEEEKAWSERVYNKAKAVWESGG